MKNSNGQMILLKRSEHLITLTAHVMKHCPNLEFVGLMTIGDLGNSMASSETNPDFEALVKYRRYKSTDSFFCVEFVTKKNFANSQTMISLIIFRFPEF